MSTAPPASMLGCEWLSKARHAAPAQLGMASSALVVVEKGLEAPSVTKSLGKSMETSLETGRILPSHLRL